MEEIRIMEKPEWVTWDEVQECIYKAQQTNNKKGFDMNFGHRTGKELCEKVGDGCCFVALNEQNRVVGTVSLKVSDIRFWWHKGKAGFHGYEAVDPKYRGTDVYFDLHAALIAKEKELGLKVLWATTAEKNNVVIKSAVRKGWKQVQYTPNTKGCDYYSVVIAYWRDGCPYSDRTINFMFKLSKMVVRILYKPGRINRFTSWIKR